MPWSRRVVLWTNVKGEVGNFSLVRKQLAIGGNEWIFRLTLVLRGISNRDNWELFQIQALHHRKQQIVQRKTRPSALQSSRRNCRRSWRRRRRRRRSRRFSQLLASYREDCTRECHWVQNRRLANAGCLRRSSQPATLSDGDEPGWWSLPPLETRALLVRHLPWVASPPPQCHLQDGLCRRDRSHPRPEDSPWRIHRWLPRAPDK